MFSFSAHLDLVQLLVVAVPVQRARTHSLSYRFLWCLLLVLPRLLISWPHSLALLNSEKKELRSTCSQTIYPWSWLSSWLESQTFQFSFGQSAMKPLTISATILTDDSNRSHSNRWTSIIIHSDPNSKHSWQEPTNLTRPRCWVHFLSGVLSRIHAV